MFGKNDVADIDQRDDGSLNVNSCFYTIQGEGPDAGRPAIFLRLASCNLRCYFCDTEFAKGNRYSAGHVKHVIDEKANRHHCRLVVITGGEPLIQNIVPLVKLLRDSLYEVAIESAGTVWLPGLERYFGRRSDSPCRLIVSPKTPRINSLLVPLIYALKYVVKEGEMSVVDGLPVMSTQIEGQSAVIYRPHEHTRVYLSPMDEQDEARNAANARAAAEACMKHGYRLTMQLHKLVGLP